MYVDPDGRAVEITGDDAEPVLVEAQKSTTSLILSRDSQTNRLQYEVREGAQLSASDIDLMSSIDAPDVQVEISETFEACTMAVREQRQVQGGTINSNGPSSDYYKLHNLLSIPQVTMFYKEYYDFNGNVLPQVGPNVVKMTLYVRDKNNQRVDLYSRQ